MRSAEIWAYTSENLITRSGSIGSASSILSVKNRPTTARPTRMDLGANALTATTRSAAKSVTNISGFTAQADDALRKHVASGSLAAGY